jgi:dihydropteroate synthase
MLNLQSLGELAAAFPEALSYDVAAIEVDDRILATSTRPAIMGTLNLSRDSTYRESIATSTESAVRKAKVMAAAGADIVDIGAESSTASAERISVKAQIESLVPVIERATDAGVVISAETYDPDVVHACLEAGAKVLNLTGLEHEESVYRLAADFDATVIICFVGGANVRDISDIETEGDPIPQLLVHFEDRVSRARSFGVDRLIIDPGMGFYYGNLVEPVARARHQTRVILNSFRLRKLGLPVCQALPHAFCLFEEEFRKAEGFFAVLASLGGVSLWRTHEVAHVRAVRDAMELLDV